MWDRTEGYVVSEWFELVRWVNVVLSGLVVVLLIAGSWARWPVMPPRFKRIAPWVIATYVVLAYGSGEAAQQGAPVGVRVALFAVTLMGLVIALLYRIDARDYES